jgi:hypothetical protein
MNYTNIKKGAIVRNLSSPDQILLVLQEADEFGNFKALIVGTDTVIEESIEQKELVLV